MVDLWGIVVAMDQVVVMVTGDTVAMGDTAEVMVTEGIDVMAMGDDVMDEFKTSKVHNFVFRYLSNI